MPQDQWVQASQEAQMVNAVCDSSGFCQFLQPTLDSIRSFYGLLYGIEVSRQEIADLAWRTLSDEWEFNRRAGLTEKDDVMADCIKQDPDRSDEGRLGRAVRQETREKLFTTKASG